MKKINPVVRKLPLIAVVGPTGIGKSRLGILLAREFRGEIVNADSRQVYRLMEIGTAKPTPSDKASAPHHLFDIIYPDQEFNLAQYRKTALDTIKDIHNRCSIPVLVGGSGQYVWAILEGWTVPRVPPNPALRKRLENEAFENGTDGLYRRLEETDPVAAQKIDKRNVRRIIRALEITIASGKPLSSLRKKKTPEYNTIIIGLTAPREDLYRRIDERVDDMIRRGFKNEVQQLIDGGYNLNLPSMSSIGYKQIGCMLRGELKEEEAVRKIKNASHRFARHQYAWFKLEDKRIHWFDISAEYESMVVKTVSDWLYCTE
ncbi:MAG: tRNA (adenosine(37)-N6)-dimethylallyltransferase MiaA [Dehalococcoidales bacterium]|nr:tRNA (adenosine(37)-N6)-dimethylallyltransferase MiaA [Dehalococcoidales bacterium]